MNKKNVLAKISVEMIDKNKDGHYSTAEFCGKGGDLLNLFGVIVEHLILEMGVPLRLIHDIVDAVSENQKDDEGDEVPEELKKILSALGII